MSAWSRVLREGFSLRGLPMNFKALAVFYRASPGLTLASLALSTLSGLLFPGFMLQPLHSSRQSATAARISRPLVLIGAIFAVQRIVDPIREELGATLWPRIDESLGDRIMAAASAPAGLQELEDPAVLDRIAQARGAVTGFTPGQAAQGFAYLWSQRIQTIGALAIVAYAYWWAAVALLVVYILSFNASRWHWDEIGVVMMGQTDKMRRAYYLRSLALSSQVAKETRIFELGDWRSLARCSGSPAAPGC